MLDISTLPFLAQERSQGAPAVWVDEHPHEYALEVLYGFRTDQWRLFGP